MEYLNIHRSTVEGEAMQDAPAAAVRAWLFLATYCAGQENGGRIAGAKGWNDRKWLKQCGLSHEDVHQETGLWLWEGEDLTLEFYPVDQELKVRKNRKLGALGGRKSGEVRRHKGSDREATVEADASSDREATVERKEKEGKEKKGKGREEARADFDFSIPTEADVRAWAERSDVAPDFAAQKWASTSERHGWVVNGELIDWQSRWLRFWKEDRGGWEARQKNRAAPGEKPAGWKGGDLAWWWSEELDLIERALHGALLGGQEDQAARLKEILKARKT